MIYMVWISDGDGSYNWFEVYPSKKRAIRSAQNLLDSGQFPDDYPLGLKYVRANSDSLASLASQDGYLVVEQRDSYYHGA